MDRQRLVPFLALCIIACGGAPQGRVLPMGAQPSTPGLALSTQTLAKNALAYYVLATETELISVELSTHFELVRRSLPEGKKVAPSRIRIDEATYDLSGMAYDSQKARLFLASTAGWVRRYDLDQVPGETPLEWRYGSSVTSLAIDSEGRYLVVGTASGVLCLRRLADGAQLQCLVAHEGVVGSLAIHGDMLASASWEGELALWELPSLRQRSASPQRKSIAAIAFSADGKTLAVARNLRPPLRSQELKRREKKSFSIDAEGDNQIEIFSISEAGIGKEPRVALQGHRNLVSALVFVGDDLLSGSWDRSLRLWSTAKGSEIFRALGSAAHIIRDVCAGPSGGRFAVAAWGVNKDAAALLWGQIRYP